MHPQAPLPVLILLAVILIILVSGIVLMAIGGKSNEKYGNKLMIARVIAQGLLVVVAGLLYMLSH